MLTVQCTLASEMLYYSEQCTNSGGITHTYIHTHSNTDSNKLVIFSGIAWHYGTPHRCWKVSTAWTVTIKYQEGLTMQHCSHSILDKCKTLQGWVIAHTIYTNFQQGTHWPSHSVFVQRQSLVPLININLLESSCFEVHNECMCGQWQENSVYIQLFTCRNYSG